MEIETTGTVKTIQTSYTWEIEDLDKYWDCNPGEAIKSSTFTTHSSNSKQKMWNIFLFLGGDCSKNKQYVSIYAQPQCNTYGEKQLCLSILNKKNKKVYGVIFYDPLSSGEEQVRWGSSRFICKHVLHDMVDHFTPNKLTILCEIVVSYIGAQRAMNYQEKKMHTDVGALLENGNFSDLTLIVEGQEFTTHRNILAARSRTFARWFKDGTINPQQDTFEIDDFTCNIFTKILQFIYTDKVDFLAYEAPDLLRAATLYGFDDLKILCEEMLGKNLSLSNVVTIHMIADLFDAERLKEHSMKFIISNAREIMDTPQYKIMAKYYPYLLQEIYEETIKRC